MSRLKSLTFCFVLLFFVLLFFVNTANAANYDVYLLAGQSNMDGRGPAVDLVNELSSYAGVQPDVFIWYSNSTIRPLQGHSEGWEPLQPGFSVPPSISKTDTALTQPTTEPKKARLRLPYKVFGPEIGFAKTMREANPQTPIYLVKFSVGGSNLKNEWNVKNRKLLYDQFITCAHEALDALKARGDTFTVRALLWHQGESDAGLPAEEYEALLAELVTRIRKDFGDPNLVVVLGEPFDNGKRIRIRTAQRSLAKKFTNVYCVSSVGLKTVDRDTHFNAASQIEIGHRFADAVMHKKDTGPVPATTQPTTPQPAK